MENVESKIVDSNVDGEEIKSEVLHVEKCN